MREFIDALARTPQSTIFLVALGLTALRLVVFPVLRRTVAHLRGVAYKGSRGINEIADSLVYAAILIFFLVRPFVFQTFVIPSGSMVPTLLVNDYIGLNKAIYRYTEPQPFDIVVFRPPVRAAQSNQIDSAGNVNVDFVKRLIGVPGDLVEIRSGELFRNGQKVDQKWVHYTRPITPDQSRYEDLPADVLATYPRASFKLVMRNGGLIPLNYTANDANAEYSRDTYSFGNGSVTGPLGDAVRGAYDVAKDYQVSDQSEMDRLKAAPAQKVPPGMYLFMGDNRNNSFDGRGWGLVPKESIVGRAEFIWLPLPRLGSLRNK